MLQNTIYSSDTEELLAKMQYDLIMETIIDQIESPFNDSRNFLEFYHDKYKFYKNEYKDDEDFIESLNEKHDETFENVLKMLEDKYELEIDLENLKLNKVTRVIYDFFVIRYTSLISNMIVNFIIKNKKVLLSELKANKSKTRDVSYITSKMKFKNQNDALLINNLNTIIFKLMPGFYVDNSIEFMTLIDDDDYTVKTMKKYLDEGYISCKSNLFDIFIEPLINREDGFSVVISNVVITLYKTFVTYNIDIIQ